ncbi:hypothetical protein BO94DRAFT_481725, partial [Aspergillus sclerotioniger CBS 115572]
MSQTISKLEKKRAQDRNAQRAARQRNKDRLALLELQVSQLQGGVDKKLSDELEQMRKERNELRTMADHLMAIAGEMKSKLGSAAPVQAPIHGESDNVGLISYIFRDYEALRTVGSTPLSPLSDTHVILNGILNGWNGPVSREEEPIQRLMAHLHRRFMLERPLARPIDQLALLYLVQMSFLFLLAQHGGRQSWVSIPGWLRPTPAQMNTPHNISIDMLPWPQLRVHLLSTQVKTAVSTNTEPCETFAVNALRNLHFSPQINFQDAYEIGLDRRLTVSAQFQQHFAPNSVSCPFAVDSGFLSEYPDFRGLVPEFDDPGKVSCRSHGKPSIPQLQSLSPFSQPGLVLGAGSLETITASDDGSCLSPEDTFLHQQHPPPLHANHAIGDNFTSELSDYWQSSVDLLADGDPGATWLL